MKVELTINTSVNDDPMLNPTTMEDYLETDDKYHLTLNEERSTVNQTIDILDLDVEGSDVGLSIISAGSWGDIFKLGDMKSSLVPSKNFSSYGGTLLNGILFLMIV